MVASFDWRSYENKGVRPATGEPIQLIPDIVVHPISLVYSGLYRQQDSESGFSFGLTKNYPGGNDSEPKNFCASRNNGLSKCASAYYEIWRWSLNHSRALAGDFQLRAAVSGQYSYDMLVSGEQFGIGGMDSVRGFAEREITNDVGWRGTTELYGPDFGGKTGIPGMRSRMLLFFDFGHVGRNRPGPAETHAENIASWGFGLRFSRGTNLAFRIDFAVVDNNGGSQTVGDNKVHASFSYIF